MHNYNSYLAVILVVGSKCVDENTGIASKKLFSLIIIIIVIIIIIIIIIIIKE